MDAVSQGNDIDKIQLSKGHRKQQKKRTWKIETTWNLIHEMEEGTHLNENGIQNDTIWQHDFRDVASVTRTQMCSLKVPTTASWSNGSCNGSAALFKTMWTRYGSFGKLEVSDDISEPDGNLDKRKWGFVMGEAQRLSKNRMESETPQDCSYWEKTRMQLRKTMCQKAESKM